MKSIMIVAISLFLAVLTLDPQDSQKTQEPAQQPTAQAADETGLQGSWYALPAGMLLTFDEQGQLHFGDPASGYTADSWFVDGKLHVRFTNYDGDSEPCRNETGVYAVSRIDDSVRFEPLDEPCHLRQQNLSGRTDFQPELRFHLVG
ncbi:MAG: hypothetical protein R3300_11340 [Candidatus Promineifilaceae bacterium]|nr:hypothetical protein [Candidatus Promineifilaceae bacterium]